eukprot:566129_1
MQQWRGGGGNTNKKTLQALFPKKKNQTTLCRSNVALHNAKPKNRKRKRESENINHNHNMKKQRIHSVNATQPKLKAILNNAIHNDEGPPNLNFFNQFALPNKPCSPKPKTLGHRRRISTKPSYNRSQDGLFLSSNSKNSNSNPKAIFAQTNQNQTKKPEPEPERPKKDGMLILQEWILRMQQENDNLRQRMDAAESVILEMSAKQKETDALVTALYRHQTITQIDDTQFDSAQFDDEEEEPIFDEITEFDAETHRTKFCLHF